SPRPRKLNHFLRRAQSLALLARKAFLQLAGRSAGPSVGAVGVSVRRSVPRATYSIHDGSGVRLKRQAGRHLLLVIFSAFDPPSNLRRIESRRQCSSCGTFAASAEAGPGAPCANSATTSVFALPPNSPIALANSFILGMLALTASDKLVLQFWK